MEQVYIMPRFAPVGLGGCCGCVWMPLRFAGFACRCASLRLGVPLRFAAFGVPLRFAAFGCRCDRGAWKCAAGQNAGPVSRYFETCAQIPARGFLLDRV